MLRWESLALPRTPLSQDDGGVHLLAAERGLSRLHRGLAPTLLRRGFVFWGAVAA
jgi:hypothetical protein